MKNAVLHFGRSSHCWRVTHPRAPRVQEDPEQTYLSALLLDWPAARTLRRSRPSFGLYVGKSAAESDVRPGSGSPSRSCDVVLHIRS